MDKLQGVSYISFKLIIFFFLSILPHTVLGESVTEIKLGISISDYQPEYLKRYVIDDLIAGSDYGLGFGAINKKSSLKYYPSFLNPFEFNFFYNTKSQSFYAGVESLGIQGFDISSGKTKFTYSPIGFFQGDGDINAKFTNQNYKAGWGIKLNRFTIMAILSLRNFRSEYEKTVTLYAPGFLANVHADSNYTATSLFPGLSLFKTLDNGKITLFFSYLPKNFGFVSNSGRVEQIGAIRFPVDILTGNLSNELTVVNYLYGEKKPQIYGVRFLLDYQYPIFSNLSFSVCLDYDRLYVYYENFTAPAFFRFTSQNPTTGEARVESSVAYAEIISSYLIYKEPILNEIRSLRLSLVASF